MTWSDAFLTAVLEEHCQGQSPPNLAERILQRAQLQPRPNADPVAPTHPGATQPTRASRGRLATATIVAFAAAMVLGVWQLATRDEAQDPQSWLPLQRGGSSEFRVTDSTGTWSYTETVIGTAHRGGRDYHLVIAHRPDPQETLGERLVAIDANGIWQDETWSGDYQMFPGFQAAPAARCHLPLPAVAGKSWEWTHDAGSTQTDYRGEVVAIDESCTVPAGTFDTIHVRSERRVDGILTTDEQWLARGIGLVRRRTQRGNEPATDARLTGYRRGTTLPPPLAALPVLLAKSDLHRLGMPDEVREVQLGVEPLVIGSAFLRVRYGTDWRLWRLTPDRLLPFDASDVATWQSLIDDERLFESPGPDPKFVATMLCGVAGRLHATETGLTVRGEVMVSRYTAAEGMATVDMNALLPAAREGGGNAEAIPIRIKIDKGRLQSIEPR